MSFFVLFGSAIQGVFKAASVIVQIARTIRPQREVRYSSYPTTTGHGSDQEKIADDFQNIGNDLFKVLNNYERKHEHSITTR